MKKLIIVIIVILILGAGWYFVSPLFIEKSVDESFPALDHLPSPDELAQMPQAELDMIQDQVMDMAANMPDNEMTDPMPQTTEVENINNNEEVAGPVKLASGFFQGADNFHKGSGLATIFELANGERVLRFEDFSVTNGPDLRVYLTAHPQPTSHADVTSGSYIEIAKLKGNKGNQNYELPADLDLSQYQSVLIYCKPFRVPFATALLK